MSFGVYEFPWGSAVKNEETSEWTNVFKSPNGEMMIVQGLGVDVTEEGVIFNEQCD